MIGNRVTMNGLQNEPQLSPPPLVRWIGPCPANGISVMQASIFPRQAAFPITKEPVDIGMDASIAGISCRRRNKTPGLAPRTVEMRLGLGPRAAPHDRVGEH